MFLGLKKLFKNQSGRSMIEMLGVLAIIGVLSVGGIAGYNKAMLKHRLNVHAQGVNFLLIKALDLSAKLDKKEDKETYYSDIFQKLNLIPDGFSYLNNSYLQDNFGNKLWIFAQNASTGGGGMGFDFSANVDGIALCQNLIAVAKEQSQNIFLLETHKYYNDDRPLTEEGIIYGDQYCDGKNKKCIASMGLKEQEALCHICDDKACRFYITWR